MRRRLLWSEEEQFNYIDSIAPSEAEVCDVVFANKLTEELTIAREWDANLFPPNKYTPIGIVVIPASHGVLKDGTGIVNQCGIMSLVPMNTKTPEVGGTSNQYIYWGGGSTDISGKSDGLGRLDSVSNGLTNYSIVNYVGESGDINDTVQGTTFYAYLPSDAFTTLANPYDEKTWYYSKSYSYIPSPYKKDESYNTAYGQTTSAASEYNAMSDFKGIVNTKILTDLATGQSGWRTASTITANGESGYYPAACCCARFKTLGTKAFVDCETEELKNGTGFWYLPSCGELGYMVVRRKAIDAIISKLSSAYGVGVQLGANDYWSSSECSSRYARLVGTSRGFVSYDDKDSDYYVRAFLRLSAPSPTLDDEFILNQTISDPTKMLIGALGKDNTPDNNTVSWIRANSHRYVGNYDPNKGMVLKQLDDNDSTKYADGTDASKDITGANGGDVFMKMPTFWFKGTMIEENKYRIHWTHEDPNDESWTKWDGNTLIGVYKATCEDTGDNATGKVYSRSGKTPPRYISQVNFKRKARNSSNGNDHFMIVTYEAHQVMALLYMCYYGNMSSRTVIGAGTVSYPNVTGATNVDGMNDTIAENSRSINFWGLENWWGDIGEYVDNLITTGSDNVDILNYNGNVVRSVKSGINTLYLGYITKMLLGEFLDVIPAHISNRADGSVTYYCDYGSVYSEAGYIGLRTISSYVDTNGPFCLTVSASDSTGDYYTASRLQYHGRVVINN